MDKKINYILIGCGVIGIMIILAGSYILFRMNPEEAVVIDPIQNTQNTEKPEIVFSAGSFSAEVSNIDGDIVTITKEDGSTENYSTSAFVGIYDNRVRDSMKPITFKDIEKGMKVQISRTVNESDKTSVDTLVVN